MTNRSVIPDALRLASLLVLLLVVVTGCSVASSKPENCAVYNRAEEECIETYAERDERDERYAREAEYEYLESQREQREQQQNQWGGGGDLDCGHFDRRRDAQAVLDSDPSDLHLLDEDSDGRACEWLDW